MRNVHILPTDKPSRLHLIEDVLMFTNKYKTSVCDSEVNIYITSDEEIKVGDWYYLPRTNSVHKCIEDPTELNLERRLGVAKIILTDNPDLIAEGVQPIDNEFLEWFGFQQMNQWSECYFYPSKTTSSATICANCGKEKFIHTIGEGIKASKSVIIPQEEPKQIKCYCGHTITCDCGPLEEPKQETLEEFIKSQPYYGYCTTEYKEGIEVGAKWQTQRIPSIIEEYLETAFISKEQGYMNPQKWFEQQKKK